MYKWLVKEVGFSEKQEVIPFSQQVIIKVDEQITGSNNQEQINQIFSLFIESTIPCTHSTLLAHREYADYQITDSQILVLSRYSVIPKMILCLRYWIGIGEGGYGTNEFLQCQLYNIDDRADFEEIIDNIWSGCGFRIYFLQPCVYFGEDKVERAPIVKSLLEKVEIIMKGLSTIPDKGIEPAEDIITEIFSRLRGGPTRIQPFDVYYKDTFPLSDWSMIKFIETLKQA